MSTFEDKIENSENRICEDFYLNNNYKIVNTNLAYIKYYKKKKSNQSRFKTNKRRHIIKKKKEKIMKQNAILLESHI